MESDIEMRVFFELRDKVDAAIGELQLWAEEHFCGTSVKWKHSGYMQEGVVLAVVKDAVIVKNSKTKTETTVSFSKIIEIHF